MGPAHETGEGEPSAEQAALGDGAAGEIVRRGEKRELGEGGTGHFYTRGASGGRRARPGGESGHGAG